MTEARVEMDDLGGELRGCLCVHLVARAEQLLRH
jgi:hypothetical protein